MDVKTNDQPKQIISPWSLINRDIKVTDILNQELNTKIEEKRKVMKLANTYYEILGKIARYRNAEEVMELPERKRLLYDMAGINIMSIAVAHRCYELGYREENTKGIVESDQLVEPMNRLIKIVDDQELSLCKNFSYWNETTDACMSIVLGTGLVNSNIEDLLKLFQNDMKFDELSVKVFEEFQALKNESLNERTKTDKMNLF
ncbi:hypothetical protein UT300012_21870 [Paraclostridium bifermentans]